MTDKDSSVGTAVHGCGGKIEFALSVRSVECIVGQEAGKVTERIEINFAALTRTAWFKQVFAAADVRVVCFDGPYDRGPDNEFVHGYMRVYAQSLDIAVGVPALSFSALRSACSSKNHGNMFLTVSPFGSADPWDGRSELLLREVHFRNELPREIHAPGGKIGWLAQG